MLAKMNHLYARVGAAAVVAILAAPESAQAQDLTAIFEKVRTNVDSASGLIGTLAYIGGAALGLGGIMKLKAHVDSPQQVPMKDGLMRLGAAGGLIALPFVIESMANTIGDPTQTLTRPSF